MLPKSLPPPCSNQSFLLLRCKFFRSCSFFVLSTPFVNLNTWFSPAWLSAASSSSRDHPSAASASFFPSFSFFPLNAYFLSLSFLLFSPSASSHHLRYIITTPMLPNRAPVRAYVVGGGGGVGVVLLLPFLLLFFPSFPALPSFFFSTSTTVLHYQIFMSTSCIIYYRYYRSPFFIAAAAISPTSSSFHSLTFWTSFSIAFFSSFSTLLYNRLTSSLWLTVEPLLLLLLIELAVVQQQQQQQLASKQPASQPASLPRIGSGC